MYLYKENGFYLKFRNSYRANYIAKGYNFFSFEHNLCSNDFSRNNNKYD